MADARLLDADESAIASTHRQGALELARRLPSLVVAAKEVAATVMHGVHGRRRAGVGETFWQFRPFVWGEPTTKIDWRRSARDDRIYVREREWEAAHTVWIWMDRSPSMAYVSTLALQSKLDRAVTLGFAAADLLVRGGERVGVPGLTRPVAARNIVDRLAEAMIEEAGRQRPCARRTAARRSARAAHADRHAQRHAERPRGNPRDDPFHRQPRRRRPRGDDLRSDRGHVPLHRPHRISRRRQQRAPARGRGADVQGRLRASASRCIATRCAKRAPRADGASRCIAPTGPRPKRCWACACASKARREEPADARPSARLLRAARSRRLRRAAGALVSAAHHAAASAAGRVSAAEAHSRSGAEGAAARAHAVVAARAAPAAGGDDHSRHGRADLESPAARTGRLRPARRRHRQRLARRARLGQARRRRQ